MRGITGIREPHLSRHAIRFTAADVERIFKAVSQTGRATATSFAGAIFVIVSFLVLMNWFGLVERSMRVFAVSKQAMGDLTDLALDDDAKETAMRLHGKTLTILFLLLTAGGFGAVAAPLGVIALLDAATILLFDDVIDALLSWWMIAAATVLMLAAVIFGTRQPPVFVLVYFSCSQSSRDAKLKSKFSYSWLIALVIASVIFLLPSAGHAYIGPGAGLSAIGALLALVAAVAVAIVGFVWFPVNSPTKFSSPISWASISRCRTAMC